MTSHFEVAGNDDYEVVVDLMGDDIEATCGCPAFDNYETCKGCGAA